MSEPLKVATIEHTYSCLISAHRAHGHDWPYVACPTCGDLWATRGAMLAHIHRLECGRTHDDGTLWSASGFGYVAPRGVVPNDISPP